MEEGDDTSMVHSNRNVGVSMGQFVLGPDWKSYVGTFLQFHLEITWTMYYGRTDFTWIVLELIWEFNRSV